MKSTSEKKIETREATQSVEIRRIDADGSVTMRDDRVICERALTVMVDRVGSFTIMCTPTDADALAVGFIYSEGMIDGIADVIAILTKEELPDVVGIEVHDTSRIAVQRNLIVASSCGMCGTRNIEKMLQSIAPCEQTLEISSDLIARVAGECKARQELFARTGGSHAAAIFDADGRIEAFAEDVGRHNAVDKAIGKCLIDGRSPRGCGVFVSGRVSLEIVTKAARAGIEIIAAVSAATSYAVEAAEKWNITLCGFARDGKMNVYTCPERFGDSLVERDAGDIETE